MVEKVLLSLVKKKMLRVKMSVMFCWRILV